MGSMVEQTCVGSPTFNLAISDNAYSEWPEHIGGLICKTPPIGSYNAPRFAQCCSGKVYNITAPTTPDDPAYPMSCALFCQVDPVFNAINYKNPYHFSDYYMCLNDGMDRRGGEVVCATNPVDGEVATPSFTSTPSGAWLTKSYSLDPWLDPSGFGDMTSKESTTTEQSTSSTSAAKTSTTGSADLSTTAPTTTLGSSISSSTDTATTATTIPNSAMGTLKIGAKLYTLGALLLLSFYIL